jgi:hypothetical protein
MITSSVWIQLPVRGIPVMIRLPKAPSSHKTSKMTMIVHNMMFLLKHVTNKSNHHGLFYIDRVLYRLLN